MTQLSSRGVGTALCRRARERERDQAGNKFSFTQKSESASAVSVGINFFVGGALRTLRGYLHNLSIEVAEQA